MTAPRALVVLLACLACTAFAADAPALAADALRAPNVVVISPLLVTSGQPKADALAQLAQQGFAAVISLAPADTSDAVRNEEEIVRRQGLEFVRIPVPFNNPTDSDFRAFADAMDRLRERKVLVHCQVNMRASTMTFLYRVVIGGEKPEAAYAAVTRVWSPDGPWKRLMVAQLKKAGVAFEPY